MELFDELVKLADGGDFISRGFITDDRSPRKPGLPKGHGFR
jgi:hypothetical protein